MYICYKLSLSIFLLVKQKKQEQSNSSTNRRRNKNGEKADHSYQEAVQDIGWSPHNPTVFVCVRGGRVELWYLSESM